MTNPQNKYVSTLMFSLDLSQVVLLEKNRPQEFAGMLMPVGGKQEPGETPEQAASREHMEETGIPTKPEDWLKYAVSTSARGGMDCFVCRSEKYSTAATQPAQPGDGGHPPEPVAVRQTSEILREAVLYPETFPPDFIALIGLAMARIRSGAVANIARADLPKLEDAHAAVKKFLDAMAPGYPTFTIVKDDDGEHGYAFFIRPDDPKSYLSRDLHVQWLGSSWGQTVIYDGKTGQRKSAEYEFPQASRAPRP